MITDQEFELVDRLIRLHDGKSYRELQEMSMPPAIADEEGRITEEMYINMCKDIENEMGVLEGIEPIECLMRKDSKFTLWKAKYTKSEYKVFWAIGFDRETLKIQDVSVQW